MLENQMPIYEYQCRECKHAFDALQKMSDDPLTDCPDCGKPELRKLLSAPNFRLKGQGWYETDFKDKNQRNLADGGANSTDASGKSADKAAGSTAAKDGKTSATKDSAGSKSSASSSGSSSGSTKSSSKGASKSAD
jgi:putative FmdB family regulatory protein